MILAVLLLHSLEIYGLNTWKPRLRVGQGPIPLLIRGIVLCGPSSRSGFLGGMLLRGRFLGGIGKKGFLGGSSID